MRTVVPFCFSIPSLADNLSNTWMNGMLMEMLVMAALTVLGNEIQADYELLCLLLTFHVFSEKITTRKEKHMKLARVLFSRGFEVIVTQLSSDK